MQMNELQTTHYIRIDPLYIDMGVIILKINMIRNLYKYILFICSFTLLFCLPAPLCFAYLTSNSMYRSHIISVFFYLCINTIVDWVIFGSQCTVLLYFHIRIISALHKML